MVAACSSQIRYTSLSLLLESAEYSVVWDFENREETRENTLENSYTFLEPGWKNIFVDFSLNIASITTRTTSTRIFVRDSVTDFSLIFENDENCFAGLCAEIGEDVYFDIQFRFKKNSEVNPRSIKSHAVVMFKIQKLKNFKSRQRED